MALKRGDVVLCVLSGDDGKPRLGLVIQSDLFNETHASLLILPITSHLIDAPLFRLSVTPGVGNGLRLPSQVMVDKLTAIRRDRVREKIGRLSPALIVKVEQMLSLFLGLS